MNSTSLKVPACPGVAACAQDGATGAARTRVRPGPGRVEPAMLRVACLVAMLLIGVSQVPAAQSAYGRIGIGPTPAGSVGVGLAWSHVEVGAEALGIETGQSNVYLGGTFTAVFLRPELRFRPHASASLLLAQSFDYSEFAAIGVGAGVTARLSGWLAAFAEARYFLPLSDSDLIDSQAAILVGVRLGRTRRGTSTRDTPAAGPDGAQ